MAEHRCRPRRRYTADSTAPFPGLAPLEAEDVPMTRYVSHCVSGPCGCGVQVSSTACRESRALLEQLVELSSGQSQLLVDLLGAVNALTAAILSAQARV